MLIPNKTLDISPREPRLVGETLLVDVSIFFFSSSIRSVNDRSDREVILVLGLG